MLQTERFEDPEEVHRQITARAISRIQTALPCVVLEDSDGHVVHLQPTIMGMYRNPETGITTPTPYPDLGHHAPVVFPSGGGFTFTHPIKRGDEGLAVFASRCIDGWWQMGGIQPQLEERWHNFSDGFFIPGIRSTPRKLNPPASTNSAQLRSDDGMTYVELAASGVINLVAPNAGRVNVQAQKVFMPDLPTADPHNPGQLWNNAGTVRISLG